MLHNTNQIKYPVGKLIAQSHLQWIWYYCNEKDRVIQKRPNDYIAYTRSINATRSNSLYITSGGILPLPPNLLYTTVTTLSPTLVRFEGVNNGRYINKLRTLVTKRC